MNKIYFRLVYNRKKKLNKSGKALIQVEAYRNRKKVYISTGIYVNPKQWDNHHSRIIQHPHSEELNRMLEEFIFAIAMGGIEIMETRYLYQLVCF